MLAACGGGGSNQPPVTPSPTPTPGPTPTPTPTPAAVTVTYPHIFGIAVSDGGQPNGPLLQASDGNFYGTTRAGGNNRCNDLDNFCGAIFRLTPSGDEAVLYSFGASMSDAYRPSGPLIQGRDGALYGLTANGGTHGAGTAFKITLNGAFTILYSFGASPSDGIVPIGGLTQGSDGDFYGATASGGANHCGQIPQSGSNCGTVFKISPSGVETVLYSFGASRSDGVTPNGSLVQGGDGNFYGTTVNGGANACSDSGATNNCGTVFRITPAGVLSVLYSFGASRADSIAPQGALIQGRDGAFYGTTASGGGGQCGFSFGCGTVFRMTSAGNVTILYAFAAISRSDGYGPSPFLIQARDGNFYGTTGSGGANASDLNGTVFRLTPSGVKTTLYSFGPLNTNPSNPVGGVIEATDGAFYGVTAYNGALGAVGNRMGTGAVFKLVVR
ncbi:MAG: choice-of-anchor tandem repeat GloVer-containing protein [Pseudomonadota bacterium]